MLSDVKRLKTACASGRMMHGCLVTGTDLEAASKLVTECASIILFGKENVDALRFSADYFDIDGSIKIDDFRDIRRELYKQTFGGKNRVVAVRDAHLLNVNVINAMLKLLEEPPEGTYFLLTGFEQRILPTIRSRCAIVRLGSAPRKTIREHLISMGAPSSEADAYAAMGMGVLSRSVKLYSDESFRTLRIGAINAMFDMLRGKIPFSWAKTIGKDRDAARESVEFMLGVCHDLLLAVNGAPPDAVPDMRDTLSEIAPHFTTNRICCIINILVDASMKLGTNASPNLILDGSIVDIVKLCAVNVPVRKAF